MMRSKTSIVHTECKEFGEGEGKVFRTGFRLPPGPPKEHRWSSFEGHYSAYECNGVLLTGLTGFDGALNTKLENRQERRKNQLKTIANDELFLAVA